MTEQLYCSRCCEPIAESYEPGPCYVADNEPALSSSHDEAITAEERGIPPVWWIPVSVRMPKEDVFVAVLYRRQGTLVHAVARYTPIAWVTPQAIAVDAEYWAPLPALPEEAQ